MASIIEGYTYDIFISYRQNDNKYDGWVTEFVDNLNKELEANIKDKISVYFDINPHDGLLETHSVDQSLEDKLKCLIFIPIISRTYCDLKSFAWQHEFCIFNKLAKEDQFGRDIRLASGNVASRILPVKIHDLDVEDQTLLENELGGILRSIEFIYKSAGVNRPLRANEDHPQDNINKTYYRDQINKVANAIKEIITGLKSEPAKSDTKPNEVFLTDSKPLKREKSIIVLPFDNMSPDPDQEYFSDGLTEEIITDLSHIHDLLVISRSSAMTFKGSNKKIKEIANEVNVKYVLEGSVRKSGYNLRITAQLIDALTDTHLWAEKYNGTLDDIFDIQEKVSRSIAESLKFKLSSEEDRSISHRPIMDVQAYEYYLKAKKEIYSWTESAMERALEYLQMGLEIVGENVLLYFGIGYVYWTYINIGFKNKEECIIKAEQYAKKIFEVDADSVYGHRLIGIINLRRSNLQQGVINLKRALSIDPNEPEALVWLGTTYCNTGKQFAAVPLADKLIKSDPFNPFGHVLSSWIDILDGRFSLALDKIKKSDKLVPGHPVTRVIYGLYLAYNNRSEESYPLLDQVMSDDPENLWAHLGQVLKYALQGQKDKTIKAMSGGVKNKARCDLYDSLLMAECDALIGENDEAITSLEYAVNLGAVNYPFYAENDPLLENIRGEERFKKLMEKVKYKWENFEV